jgi:hypothetical protein
MGSRKNDLSEISGGFFQKQYDLEQAGFCKQKDITNDNGKNISVTYDLTCFRIN